jgi:hypothetical protein
MALLRCSVCSFVLGRPGDDLLSQVLRHSTIGAEEFNGRVRDGIGFRLLATATRPAKDRGRGSAGQLRCKMVVVSAQSSICGRGQIFDLREGIGNESDQADQAISTG